jgi:hypothetical protein
MIVLLRAVIGSRKQAVASLMEVTLSTRESCDLENRSVNALNEQWTQRRSKKLYD